jgi:isopentenyl diphosphate isomerase/L-lactate dehydrogenase-like FMN-dependent dehydrogenase
MVRSQQPLPRVLNINDLLTLAKRRLPKAVFDYVDGGAEQEVTLRNNCEAFKQVTFRPKQAVSVGTCQLNTQVLEADLAFPAMLAPIGYSRLMHPGGEVAAARAAEKAGIGYILSTISGHKMEHVKAAISGPAWYQLYLLGGREAAESAIERARSCGFSALVITVDTAVAGLRERDPRNGMRELLAQSFFPKIPFLPGILAHPAWLISFLRDGGVPKLENIVVPGLGPMPLMDVAAGLNRSAVTWEDFKWIRDLWQGPLVVKGILTGEDARHAVEEGASAIVVSNHGGRQLDCVSPTLAVLREVIAAVDPKVEVLIDGGIRRGSDIVKAVCMGARAVLIGRVYAYGLAAAGEAGVVRALEILRDDVERTLRLLGCRATRELDLSFVRFPREWQATN